MQEAIELVKKYDSRKISYNVLLGNLELLLEKEKEQIMKAVYDSMGCLLYTSPSPRDQA